MSKLRKNAVSWVVGGIGVAILLALAWIEDLALGAFATGFLLIGVAIVAYEEDYS